MERKIINGIDYHLWLVSPEWKSIREHKLESVGYKCERCGKGGVSVRLNVHHKTYERIGYESNTDLEVLCYHCHMNEHRGKPIEIYYESISAPNKESITSDDMYAFNRLMIRRYGNNWQYRFTNESIESMFSQFLTKNQR